MKSVSLFFILLGFTLLSYGQAGYSPVIVKKTTYNNFSVAQSLGIPTGSGAPSDSAFIGTIPTSYLYWDSSGACLYAWNPAAGDSSWHMAGSGGKLNAIINEVDTPQHPGFWVSQGKIDTLYTTGQSNQSWDLDSNYNYMGVGGDNVQGESRLAGYKHEFVRYKQESVGDDWWADNAIFDTYSNVWTQGITSNPGIPAQWYQYIYNGTPAYSFDPLTKFSNGATWPFNVTSTNPFAGYAVQSSPSSGYYFLAWNSTYPAGPWNGGWVTPISSHNVWEIDTSGNGSFNYMSLASWTRPPVGTTTGDSIAIVTPGGIFGRVGVGPGLQFQVDSNRTTHAITSVSLELVPGMMQSVFNTVPLLDDSATYTYTTSPLVTGSTFQFTGGIDVQAVTGSETLTMLVSWTDKAGNVLTQTVGSAIINGPAYIPISSLAIVTNATTASGIYFIFTLTGSGTIQYLPYINLEVPFY